MAAASSAHTPYEINFEQKQNISPQDDGTELLDLILIGQIWLQV